MEDIARDTGMTTKDLSLPIKKLLGASQVTTEGQKRATRYFPAGAYTRKRRPGGRKKKR
jgi:YD repeat-containing protein